MTFKNNKSINRRMVLIVIMTVLSVLGRFIPVIKPVAALTVITGIYLGGISGFMTGALTAVISNIYWGQGPWTPFQMFGWGLIGLMAGLLHELLKNSKVALYAYGAIAGIAYSMIMDVWTVLWYNGSFDATLYRAALITAAPYTVIYAISNVVFLVLLEKPIGNKLERINIKYL